MILYHESFYNNIDLKRRNELIKRLNLDVNKKIEELSLGNKKKLGILLALIHSPKILILDEPTSGLDPIAQQEFYNILKEEKQKGVLIIYSTHILSEISKICDKVGIIKNGTLLEVLSVKELHKNFLSKVIFTSNEYKKIMEELKMDYKIIDTNTVEFNSKIGDNLLIKTLSKYDIDKLYINEPTLEDLFLKYYMKESK